MRVIVTASSVDLVDLESFDAFSVHHSHELTADNVAQALRQSGAGRAFSGDEVAIDVDWLHRKYSDSAAQPDGRALEAMIQYAVTKGWTVDQGRSVLAHLVAHP